MATIPVIDALDQCKIALQYIAERQSDSLTTVLEILLERLDIAIGQVHTQLLQCTCSGSSYPRVPSVSVPRGPLTVVPRCRPTPQSPASLFPEDLLTGDDLQAPDDSHDHEGA